MPYREVYALLDDPEKNLLNKRLEIISQCRHKNKYRLKTLASSMTSGDITLKKYLYIVRMMNSITRSINIVSILTENKTKFFCQIFLFFIKIAAIFKFLVTLFIIKLYARNDIFKHCNNFVT